jgi:hypothetical protein
MVNLVKAKKMAFVQCGHRMFPDNAAAKALRIIMRRRAFLWDYEVVYLKRYFCCEIKKN